MADGPIEVVQSWDKLLTMLEIFNEQAETFTATNLEQMMALGESFFHQFYELGVVLKANQQTVEKFPQNFISAVTKCVTTHQSWIECYLAYYGHYSITEIDFDGSNPAVNICKVRSGIQFLLDDFREISEDFKGVLNDIEEYGYMDLFDERLKKWISLGVRGEVDPRMINPNLPMHHWWWFKFTTISHMFPDDD